MLNQHKTRRVKVHRLVAILLISTLSIFLPGASTSATHLGGKSPPVPQEFSDLYSLLDDQLQEAESYLNSHWNGEKHGVIFSAELLAANGNQGEQLLREQTWPSVLLSLDRLQLLGVRAVKVAIKYPMLVPAFPHAAEYLNFFKRLAQELKSRNLKFLVQITTAFREPAFSTLPVAGYYAGLTIERYKQEKRQMTESIIREIHPDYLTVENEPRTQQENTGLPFTVQNVTEIVQYILDGLDRSGVLIGAGAGTWDNPAYIQSLAQSTTVDYLDMHIYPVNGDFLMDRAIRIAEIAKSFHKRVILGEVWLYKSRDRELGGQAVAAAPALIARDVFSFWEPLDVKFITVIVGLSHYLELELASFFWMRYFFAYLEYNEATKQLTPTELFRMANMEAAKNMLADPPKLTQTGLAFQRLIKP